MMHDLQVQKNCFMVILLIRLQINVVLASLEKKNLDLYLEDDKQNTSGLAAKYGHPCSQYEVITKDGYILTLFRIPNNKRDPILLIHGFQSSSDDWLLRGKKSLAITLAKKGYDLWLCNLRGNRYSRRHLSLDPNTNNNFWNFTFHEQGYYDLPAIIDKVLNETHVEKLTAMGHSQGNTIFYVLGSTRSEYNSKIKVLIAVSPICYLQNTKLPNSIFVKLSLLLDKMFKTLGPREALGDSMIVRNILKVVCSLPLIGYRICAFGIIFPLGGYDPVELKPVFFRKIVPYFPAGSSWKTVGHYLQVSYRKEFAQFDYGPEVNKGVYNLSSPPVYDLSKVTMPVALIAGRNDHLSTLEDIALLRKRLPNVVSYNVSPWHLFNHYDAVWGRRMHVYLYPQIFSVLRKYSGCNKIKKRHCIN